MGKSYAISLKTEVIQFLKDRGAFKVRVANPSASFQKAVAGCHPFDLMKDCRSVIVFSIYMGLEYYRTIKIEGKKVADDRIGHIFRDWLAYELADFLKSKGFRAIFPSGFFDRDQKLARLSYKLAAHEAGIGVYGKSGLIITPEYGPRVNIGVVVTNAVLEPDKKLNFNPCQACRKCARLCPVKAIQGELASPTSHNRKECLRFVQRLREEVDDEKFLCGYCYDRCPVGKTRKKGFLISRYRTLLNVKSSERRRVIQQACIDRR